MPHYVHHAVNVYDILAGERKTTLSSAEKLRSRPGY